MPEELGADPGSYRRRVGDIDVFAVSDGIIEASLSVVANRPAEEVKGMLEARGQPIPPRISVNAYVLRDANHVTLIDTGAGGKLGPTLGKLTSNLAAAGIAPHQVDTVLLTHMHPDHSNGLTGADGNAAFPNAELVLHEEEMAHWLDDGRMAQASPRLRRDNFEAARLQLPAYRDRIRVFRGGIVLPNVEAILMRGHTPGHTGYRIASGRDALLIWGDLVHLPDIQVAHPDVCVVLDTDKQQAADTRRSVLDFATQEALPVAGMHLHFPGFSRVTRERNGFGIIADG